MTALHGEGAQLCAIELAGGRTASVDALFLGPRNYLNSDIGQRLGCETDEAPFGRTIRTDPQMMTTVPGVYAAGDITRGAHSMTWACQACTIESKVHAKGEDFVSGLSRPFGRLFDFRETRLSRRASGSHFAGRVVRDMLASGNLTAPFVTLPAWRRQVNPVRLSNDLHPPAGVAWARCTRRSWCPGSHTGALGGY